MQDDAVPTWARTALLMGVVSPFAISIAWMAVHAVITAHLEPVSFDCEYMFGQKPLNGRQAVVAGYSCVFLGSAFASLLLAYSRFAANHRSLRWLPWDFPRGYHRHLFPG